MPQVTKEELISILERITAHDDDLKNCESALLIGSRAAYQRSETQRKPVDDTDWDFIISPSYLLSWLRQTSTIVLDDIHISSISPLLTDEKQKITSQISNVTFLLSPATTSPNNDHNQISTNTLSIRMPLKVTSEYYRFLTITKIVDIEVPITLNCSYAQILLYEFSTHHDSPITPWEFDGTLQVKVASMEVLFGMKKSTLHPTRWLSHTEDYHSMKSQVNEKNMSKELNTIMELHLNESAQIHKVEIKNVEMFDCHEFLQVTPQTQELMAKYNSNSWKLSQSKFENPTNDQIQFVAELLATYTLQNKLFSPLASMEVLATSKTPSLWWTEFLRDLFPQIQQLFMDNIPTVTPAVSLTSSTTTLPSTWIFPHVPFEIAVIIASFIDITSPYQVSQLSYVCRNWKEFFNNDFNWKMMFQRIWTDQPEASLSWKTNYIIHNHISIHNRPKKLIKLTCKFQQITVDDLVSLWETLLKVSRHSFNSLKLCIANIRRLHWMIQHTFINDVSHSKAEEGPSMFTMDFFIGCKELPKFSHHFKMTHQYGQRGSSRYSLQAKELTIRLKNNVIRKFDGPSLYGLRYSKYGLVGDFVESSDLSRENSELFGLPEGIITAFFIQLAECQTHVKSYFQRNWRSELSEW